MRRLAAILLVAACTAVAVAGFAAHLSGALFTAQTAVAGNTVTVDKLANYFQVTPGSAVQVNTSTPVASGTVDTLALTFALVPRRARSRACSRSRTSRRRAGPRC